MATIHRGSRTPNRSSSTLSEYSYSGPDFDIWAYFPTESAGDVDVVRFANMQAITTSMTSSLSAVERIGYSGPVGFTRGQKTFAGSLIFTVFDREPLYQLLNADVVANQDFDPEFLTLDQLPPFNIVIQGQSEILGFGANGSSRDRPESEVTKIIVGVRLLQNGETISIDDFFLEQSHTYTSEYITPWMSGLSINYSLLTPKEDNLEILNNGVVLSISGNPAPSGNLNGERTAPKQVSTSADNIPLVSKPTTNIAASTVTNSQPDPRFSEDFYIREKLRRIQGNEGWLEGGVGLFGGKVKRIKPVQPFRTPTDSFNAPRRPKNGG